MMKTERYYSEHERGRRGHSSIVLSVLLHGMVFVSLLGFMHGKNTNGPKASIPCAISMQFKSIKEPSVATTMAAGIREVKKTSPIKPRNAIAHQAVVKTTHNVKTDSPPVILADNTPTMAPSRGAQNVVNDNMREGFASNTSTDDAPITLRPSPLLVNGNDVKVPYPEKARLLMVEGIVRLRLTVSETGRVIDAEILSGPAFGLRAAALLVARKLFFLPATDAEGNAMTAQVDHDVIFKLTRS